MRTRAGESGGSMTAKHTFASVLAEHSQLEQLFDKHQRALLSKDLEGAVATLKTFENELGRHVAVEDEVLLPLYAAKGGEVEGGTLAIFHAEHRKLQELTASLARETAALESTSDLLGSILKLFDQEALFKGLFSHHAVREENLLFPRLEACTTAAERRRLFRRIFPASAA
jgi:hemerythrin-like domain-containing protein